MIKKVIIISLLPLNKMYKERLLMNILDEKNIEYEYWSTYYIHYLNEPKIYNRVEQKNEKIFKTIEEIESEAKKLKKDTLVILENIYQKKMLSLKLILLKNEINVIEVAWGKCPEIISFNKKARIRIKKILKLKLIKNYLKYWILNKYFRYIFENKNNQYKFLYAGKKSNINTKNGIEKNISIMSEDYEKYTKLSKDIKLRNQAVFIDQNLPAHPDFDIVGEKKIEAKSYYEQLNKFFSNIEKKLNLEVVIAAHPKSNYNSKIFNGRKIVQFKTMEEIKKSKLVLSSFSTSLGAITIENKPAVLIKTTNFTPDMLESVKVFEKELGLSIINISNDYVIDKIPIINYHKYKEYCRNYLYDKVGNEEKSFSKYVLETLERFNK